MVVVCPSLLVSGYKVNNLQLVKLVACVVCILKERTKEREIAKGYKPCMCCAYVFDWSIGRSFSFFSHFFYTSQGPSNVVVVVYWVGLFSLLLFLFFFFCSLS